MSSRTIRKFVSRNPYTNTVLKEFPFISNNELLQKIEKSNEAFLHNRRLSIPQRKDKLYKLAGILESHVEKYAQIITTEMGKPIISSIAEVKKCASHCKYYADHAEKYITPIRVKTEAKKSLIEFEPLGSIYQLAPFNFPLWLVFKGCIPSILLGNTILHRNSDSTPLCGLAAEEAFIQAGYDAGEFQNVFASPDQTDLILSNKHIKGVSFTGSSKAGSMIASTAGKYLKKSIMELGGSDPFIILGDADLDKACTLAASSRLANAGQVCFSGKRFIIEERIYDRFKNALHQKVKEYKIGDPMQKDTQLGPLARIDLVDNIEKQVQESVKQGGKILCGGVKGTGDLGLGNFFMPTIVECDENNILTKEETFGPVFALIKAKNDKDCLRIANNNDYGLGAVIVSKDLGKAEEMAKQIQTGMVFINEVVKSDSRLPSGGIKASGYGRECAEFGVHEFANIKTLWVAYP